MTEVSDNEFFASLSDEKIAAVKIDGGVEPVDQMARIAGEMLSGLLPVMSNREKAESMREALIACWLVDVSELPEGDPVRFDDWMWNDNLCPIEMLRLLCQDWLVLRGEALDGSRVEIDYLFRECFEKHLASA